MALSRYPGILHPTVDNILSVVKQLKESVEIGQRARGDINDSFVRYSEFTTLKNRVDAFLMVDAWDDLRFPAQAINPVGGVNPPDLDNTTGALLFDADAVEIIAGIAQMPHAWHQGTTIKPHIHWTKTSSASGDVVWLFEYEVVNNGEVAPLTYTNTYQTSSVVAGTPDNDTANEMLITSLDDISMVGKKISCIIFWKLSRVATDGSDTYAADARLVELDFHYQIDSNGSTQLFTK